MIPIRTSIYPRKTPYVNYALIVVNVALFLLTYSPHIVVVGSQRVLEELRPWSLTFMLTSNRLYLWQFITYAFLHVGYAHIIGNMFFLYIFGNNVNDKLGNTGYLCFYLAGAVFSGIGHVVFSGGNVLGASGAVAAVTGAYLVLFPKTLITVLYWFIFIGTFEISALYFILLKMIFFDNILNSMYDSRVAYDAHLSGYAFGIIVILLLLGTKLIESSQLDLWVMIKQWNRRRGYRGTVADGYSPFAGRMGRKSVKAKEVKKNAAEQAQDETVSQLRGRIAGLINKRNLPEAAEQYLELVRIDPGHVLAGPHQLDIANQLMSMGRWQESARAYEGFLAHYKSYEYLEQVELMLGILYSRYLDEPAKAAENLKAARQKLTDTGQIKMCEEELAKLEG